MIWLVLGFIVIILGLFFWLCLRELSVIRRSTIAAFDIMKQLMVLQKDYIDPELARLGGEDRRQDSRLKTLDRRLELNDNAIGGIQQKIRELAEEYNLADVLADNEEEENGN